MSYIRAGVVQWSEAQLSNLVTCGRIPLSAQNWLGATAHADQSGLTCRPMREEKGWRAQFVQIRKTHGGFSTSKSFSLFQYHWSNEVQPNLIRPQFKGLEKEPLERWNFTSILSLGPLRRIHFHFAKYRSLLIQCVCSLLSPSLLFSSILFSSPTFHFFSHPFRRRDRA